MKTVERDERLQSQLELFWVYHVYQQEKKTSESHPTECCCETSSGETTTDDSATIQYIHTE